MSPPLTFLPLHPSRFRRPALDRRAPNPERQSVVKVIASSLRKGNVVEYEDGKLYVILTTQNIHPGKGTPVTQVEMRRIVDGIKVTERYKTTDSVEKAFVEELKHNFLYDDGSNHVFMNPETFEQLEVPHDVLGEQAAYLQENMEVWLTVFEGVALAATLPTRVTLEITETEPVVKGQTASSSYKPAKLSNGLKTMVPPHIQAGTRVVVNTEDNRYVERAKD
jgi:elongation factor P